MSNVHNLPWEDLIIEVVQVFTDSDEIKQQVRRRTEEFNLYKELNSELLAYISKIKKDGYKIGIFSNHTSALRAELKDLQIDHLFDEIIISGEIGIQKPQREAFEILFKKLNVLPQELVFIDDTSKNLQSAEQIGYNAILYTNNTQLKQNLELFGVYS